MPEGIEPADRFPAKVAEILLRAGWRPGRKVDVESWRTDLGDEYVMHRAAEEFLGEFGGLRVRIGGQLAERSVMAFEFDPLHGEGDGGRLADWGADLGRSLFPVGAFITGHPFVLAIDETGELYHVGESIAGYGPMPEALVTLAQGTPQPLLEDFAPLNPRPGKAERLRLGQTRRVVRTASRRGSPGAR